MADEIGLEVQEDCQTSVQVPFTHRLGRPVQKFLGDAGLYSYCAICALSLHDLFPDEWDREFSEKWLAQLIRHLSLPAQVQPVMQALMRGEGGELEPFIHVLKEEPGLNGNCLRVVEDLILFAVQGGEKTLYMLYNDFQKLIFFEMGHAVWAEVLYHFRTIHVAKS